MSEHYCECYDEPEDAPLCEECLADEREQDERLHADMFLEDQYLYSVSLRTAEIR